MSFYTVLFAEMSGCSNILLFGYKFILFSYYSAFLIILCNNNVQWCIFVIFRISRMGVFAQMKTWFLFHLLLSFNFIFSGIIISVLMLFVWMLVWPFNRTLYRKIVVCMAYTVWCRKFQFILTLDCNVHNKLYMVDF